jgi:hypothetical protein
LEPLAHDTSAIAGGKHDNRFGDEFALEFDVGDPRFDLCADRQPQQIREKHA